MVQPGRKITIDAIVTKLRMDNWDCEDKDKFAEAVNWAMYESPRSNDAYRYYFDLTNEDKETLLAEVKMVYKAK